MFACLVDIRTFGWDKLFSTAHSLWGCVNQFFLITPLHQGRAVGKGGQLSLTSLQKIDVRKLTRRTRGLKGLCKVATPIPSLRKSHLSKDRSHSAPSSHPNLSAPLLHNFSTKVRKPFTPSYLSKMVHCRSHQTSAGTFNPCRVQRSQGTMRALCLWQQGTLLWNVIECTTHLAFIQSQYLFLSICVYPVFLFSCVYFLLASLCLNFVSLSL